MALILCIESSTRNASVALFEGTHLIAENQLGAGQSAASHLHPVINQTLESASLKMPALDAVAVAMGPGSYTGLRLGMAAAKGLCYALQIPLIVLDSLQILAEGAMPFNTEFLCPMIDARRMEVYCCLINRSGSVEMPSQPKVIDTSSFADLLEKHTISFVGEAAEKCRDVITHKNAQFNSQVTLKASLMKRLAVDRFERKEFAELELTEPLYLKEFVAKTKLAQ